MNRIFEPLEGRAIKDSGPLANEPGYMVTRGGRDEVDFSESELEEMLAAIKAARQLPLPHIT